MKLKRRERKWRKMERLMERARGQRRVQVTQLSLWKQIEGSCGFEPPKVLLEHRLFNRREKQCYSCFLHHQVFPTSKYSRDWVIMLWSGIRWIVFFSPPLLFSMWRNRLQCSRNISHQCYCALTCSICNAGAQTHSLCEWIRWLLSFSSSQFNSFHLSFLLCLLNVTCYFPTRQTGGNSDVKQPAYPFTVRSVNAVECLCVCLFEVMPLLSVITAWKHTFP